MVELKDYMGMEIQPEIKEGSADEEPTLVDPKSTWKPGTQKSKYETEYRFTNRTEPLSKSFKYTCSLIWEGNSIVGIRVFAN